MSDFYSVETLKNDLATAGICAGDTVLVHSSMKKIGNVENRADGVFSALMQTITRKGLLLFPTFSYEFVTDAAPDFNIRTTPACTGILPELFRQRTDVIRSVHPFHSLTAWGDDAESFTAGHEQFETAFDPQSPWGRLLERNAKILLLGVDLNSATFLHPVEQWCGVPVLSEAPVLRYIVDENGNRTPRTIFWHTGAHSENYIRAEKLLLGQGAMIPFQFGNADSFVMDSCKTLEVMKPVLLNDPDFFAHH